MTEESQLLERMHRDFEKAGVVIHPNRKFVVPEIQYTLCDELNRDIDKLIKELTDHYILTDDFGTTIDDHVDKRRPWRREMRRKYGDLFNKTYENKMRGNWFSEIFSFVENINDIAKMDLGLSLDSIDFDMHKFHYGSVEDKIAKVHEMEGKVIAYLSQFRPQVEDELYRVRK
jgi:hypothetical protein